MRPLPLASSSAPAAQPRAPASPIPLHFDHPGRANAQARPGAAAAAHHQPPVPLQPDVQGHYAGSGPESTRACGGRCPFAHSAIYPQQRPWLTERHRKLTLFARDPILVESESSASVCARHRNARIVCRAIIVYTNIWRTANRLSAGLPPLARVHVAARGAARAVHVGGRAEDSACDREPNTADLRRTQRHVWPRRQ